MWGSVSIIELSKSVTESIEEDEVNDIQTQTAETYGVGAEDVSVEVVYQTTGTIDVDVAPDTNIEKLEESFESEIATLLGLHEGSVEVTIEDGLATYTITSNSVESAQSIQDILDEPSSASILDEALPITIHDINVNEGITADIVVTVDSSSASNNLNSAADTLEDIFEDSGFDAKVESNSRRRKFETLCICLH